MPKNKLNRLKGIKEAVQALFIDKSQQSIPMLLEQLETRGFVTSYQTLKIYLEEMVNDGLIKKQNMGPKLSIWSVI